MTTPITPDRLREILERGAHHVAAQYRRVYYTSGASDWESCVAKAETDLRALIADERRDAARKERERCARVADGLSWPECATHIRLLPDEETP